MPSKVMLLGDVHFGAKKDSPEFQQSIIKFIDWAIELANEQNVTHCVQMGDWFDSRNSVNVNTVNIAIDGARKLSDAFGRENFFILMGNHDLFHLHRLDVSSLAMLEPYANIVNDLACIIDDSILAAPWIVDEEMWNLVVEGSNEFKYLFGHLELNGFLVNDRYEMTSGFSHKELKHYKKIVTGHYHSPQKKDNVQYLGTPYPITMSDANEAHGIWFFTPSDGNLEFVEYTGSSAVSISLDDYRKLDMTQFVPENTNIRIEFPDDLEDEMLLESVRKELEDQGFREIKIKYRGNKAKEIMEQDVDEIEAVDNIDALVLSYIAKSSSVAGVSKEKLKELYEKSIGHSNDQI